MVDNQDNKEDIEDNNNTPYSQNHILDLQAKHGSYIVGMIYAQAILEALGEVASIQQ